MTTIVFNTFMLKSMINSKLFLIRSIALLSLLSCSQHLISQQPITLFNSEDKGVSCYRIPAIAVTEDQTILVAVDERVPSCGDLKWSGNINIVLRRSIDHGVTWKEIERIIDFPEGISASDPSFVVDQETATIFLFYNYMDLINEPDIYRFQYIKSTDNGANWSTPIDITDQISHPDWKEDFMFITSGRGIQTKQGVLLHTLVHLEKGAFVFGSDDHGASWDLKSEALHPGDESKIVELNNGKWMVNSRVNKAGLRYIHVSDDQGMSWNSVADYSLIDPSCNAALLKHSDGTLYFSNLNDPADRKNLVLRKSVDNGRTWEIIRTIYEGPAAYSTMELLKDGSIVIAVEKDDYNTISFVLIKDID